jgi:hypothetical protein
MLFPARWSESSKSGPGSQTGLTERFGEKFNAKNEWSPRSPDLNPCDYFVWGFLKQRVYTPLPKTLEDLRSNFTSEIENIPAQMIKETFLNFRKMCELLISAGGGHIENKLRSFVPHNEWHSLFKMVYHL